MIITKFLTLLFIALLPWLALSLNEIKTTMKPKDKVDYLKLAADALKDLPLYAEKFEKALQSADAWNKDFMQILMFAGPFGWVLSVGLGVSSTYLDKNKKDLVKAAVGDLSKKIDMLSAHIDDSINRVIAHEDILQFQSEVVLPFKKLREKYKDYLEHLHEEERQKLKQSCKEIKPLDLFDVMDQILTDKWDNLLKSMKYTDYSFNKLNSLYENTMKEMIPIYFTCEALIYDSNVLYNGEQMKNNTKRRTEKLAKRIQAIFTTFDLIKERRPGLVWSIMPKKIEFWHGKFREIKKADRNFQDFSQKMVDELVSDYGKLGYRYIAGVYKEKKFYFGCEDPEICIHKIENDFAIFIMKTKPCRKNHATSTSKCLQLQMQLYELFENDNAFKHKKLSVDLKTVTERFKRNCRTRNAIGIRKKEAYKTRKQSIFKILTEKSHDQCYNPYAFHNYLIISDCKSAEDEHPFNYMEEYCTSDSSYPSCILTEEAYNYHLLKEHKSICQIAKEVIKEKLH